MCLNVMISPAYSITYAIWFDLDGFAESINQIRLSISDLCFILMRIYVSTWSYRMTAVSNMSLGKWMILEEYCHISYPCSFLGFNLGLFSKIILKGVL